MYRRLGCAGVGNHSLVSSCDFFDFLGFFGFFDFGPRFILSRMSAMLEDSASFDDSAAGFLTPRFFFGFLPRLKFARMSATLEDSFFFLPPLDFFFALA